MSIKHRVKKLEQQHRKKSCKPCLFPIYAWEIKELGGFLFPACAVGVQHPEKYPQRFTRIETRMLDILKEQYSPGYVISLQDEGIESYNPATGQIRFKAYPGRQAVLLPEIAAAGEKLWRLPQ